MIEMILRAIFWGIQIGALAAIAAVFAWLVQKVMKRKLFAAILIAVLILECICAGYVAEHPAVNVPEEYREYISDEKQQEIVAYNHGFYSSNIPIFPVMIQVLHADEQEIRVRTQYLFWGSTEMSITDDGPSITKPLSSLS